MPLSEIEQRRRDVAVAQLRLAQAQTPQDKAQCERMLMVAQRNVLAASGYTVAPMPKHLRPARPVTLVRGSSKAVPETQTRPAPPAPVQVIASAEASKPQPVLMGPPTCVCGESIPLGRRKLGYRTCIDCGSETIKFMVMDVPKSNGIVTANKQNLLGLSGSHKGRG